MSLFKIFSPKTAEVHERKGDGLIEAGQWGKAKLAYERALERLERADLRDVPSENRVRGKISQSKEGLARRHYQTAVELMDGDALEDAFELVILASELSGDPELLEELERMRAGIENGLERAVAGEFEFVPHPEKGRAGAEMETPDDEYFHALCGTLPEEIQDAYQGYGASFRDGYVALNRGDFEAAVEFLSRAVAEHPSPDSYIPLELATAYWNSARSAEALELLEPFIHKHPDALPAYQLVCEIFWEQGAFERAEALLSGVPAHLAATVAVHLLKGETLLRAGNYPAAQIFYTGFLQTYGINEAIARALAVTYEALGEPAKAREVYANIMGSCTGCGARIDPMVKHKYADLSFESGEHTMDILELYLGLVRERPDFAADFYDKISRIYAARGYDEEARRFRTFALRADRENQ